MDLDECSHTERYCHEEIHEVDDQTGLVPRPDFDRGSVGEPPEGVVPLTLILSLEKQLLKAEYFNQFPLVHLIKNDHSN